MEALIIALILVGNVICAFELRHLLLALKEMD
jgi:hypothetical protein